MVLPYTEQKSRVKITRYIQHTHVVDSIQLQRSFEDLTMSCPVE